MWKQMLCYLNTENYCLKYLTKHSNNFVHKVAWSYGERRRHIVQFVVHRYYSSSFVCWWSLYIGRKIFMTHESQNITIITWGANFVEFVPNISLDNFCIIHSSWIQGLPRPRPLRPSPKAPYKRKAPKFFSKNWYIYIYFFFFFLIWGIGKKIIFTFYSIFQKPK